MVNGYKRDVPRVCTLVVSCLLLTPHLPIARNPHSLGGVGAGEFPISLPLRPPLISLDFAATVYLWLQSNSRV